MIEIEKLKKQAALEAMNHIESGMVVGLGTGSTAKYVTQELGHRLSSGELKNIKGVPTSKATAELAQELKIPLIDLAKDIIDVAIDGMDEVTPKLEAIKGLGGALLREKIVALQADTLILIGDKSKWVTRLGQKSPVPVEVVPFGFKATISELESFEAEVKIRMTEDKNFVSDNGNYIFDCYFPDTVDIAALAPKIKQITGVVEHGIFLIAEMAYIATENGILNLRKQP